MTSPPPKERPSSRQGSINTLIRYIAAGLLNTALTFVLYWALLGLMHFQLAYAISYCAGIAVSYLLNSRVVFRSSHSLKKIALFPLIYLASYLAGAAILQLAIKLGVPKELAPVFSVAITLPLSFALTKLLLSPRQNPA